MKTKTIITILLIAVILVSCAPAAKIIPTETTVPGSTFTPVPTVTPTNEPLPSTATMSPTESKSDILIGISSFSDQKWLLNNLTTLLEEKGYKVVHNDNDDIQNAEQQNNQIDRLVAEGVKILIVSQNNIDLVAVATVDRAALAGVKVIACGELIKTPHIAAFISTDNIEIGRQQSQGILKALDIDHWDVAKKGPVQLVELGGAEIDPSSYMFRKGQDEVLKPYVENGLVQVIANPWVENWDPANAVSIMEDLLVSQNDRVDAVVASNDGMALGALQVLNAHHKKIPISGQDATAEGINSIVQGQLTLTILKDANKFLALTIDVVDKLAKGEEKTDLHKISLVELTGDDMLAGDVYVAFLPFQLIIKDNLYDLVVKTGYQSYDDVYKNVPEDQRPPRP
jgi:D-xylose transport system substrate-binding protein